MSESEFGSGFTYCLGLFLAHADRNYERLEPESEFEVWMWFSAAGDHLFEFQADEAPPAIRERCIALKEKGIEWRYNKSATIEDKKWAIQEAKDLLREYDNLCGFVTSKGAYE